MGRRSRAARIALRGRRFVLWLRGAPGLVPAVLMLVLLVLSYNPMREHLESEAAAISVSEVEGFVVTPADVVYGSIQLFTANMQPVSTTDPSGRIRLFRILAPLIVVWWVTAAFSRAARSLVTRTRLRWVEDHLVVCGPEERILDLVREWRAAAWDARRWIVAVTDGPLSVEVERALRRAGVRAVPVVADGSRGAFANAVSRAWKVVVDFDDAATTVRFAEAALEVGRQRRIGDGHPLSRWPFRAFSNAPAVEVDAFVNEIVPAGLNVRLGLEPRLRISNRLQSMARAVSDTNDFVRGSMAGPLRLVVITDDPKFIEHTGVFRSAFRQAERRLVEVLLVGAHDVSAWERGGDAAWRKVRVVPATEDLEYSLRWIIDRPEEPDTHFVPAGSPVIVCAEPFLALRVIFELLRIGRSRGGHTYRVAYAPREPFSPSLLEQGVDLLGDVVVVPRDPLELLRILELASPELVVGQAIAAHLALWDDAARAPALGPLPGSEGMRADPHRFATTFLQVLFDAGWAVEPSGGVDEGVEGFGPEDLRVLLERVERDDTSAVFGRSSIEVVRQRGALLDLLARVPWWLSRGGFGLHRSDEVAGGEGGSAAARGQGSAVRFTDDDLRAMAAESHRTYLETVGEQLAEDMGDRQALVEWELLTPAQQEANLAQVRHLPTKLALLGFAVVRGDDGDRAEGEEQRPTWRASAVAAWPTDAAPSDDDRRELARLEHARWSIELAAQGYLPGSSRSAEDRTHPDLVAFEQLAPPVVAFDLNVVDSMPRVLGAAGLHIVRG